LLHVEELKVIGVVVKGRLPRLLCSCIVVFYGGVIALTTRLFWVPGCPNSD
jgi:hypothetical protein